MSTIKSVALTFFTKIVIFCFGIVSSILLARMLGPSERGAYALIILIPITLSTLLKLGTEEANIFLVGKKKYNTGEILFNALLLSSVLGIISILLVFSGIDYLQRVFLPTLDKGLVKIASLCIPFLLLTSFVQSIYLGINAIPKYNLFETLRSLCFAILLTIFLVVLHWQLNGGIVSWILVSLFTGVLPFCYLVKIIPEKPKYNFAALRDSLSYGLRNHLGVVSSFLHYRIDMFLVGYFTNDTEVGLYAIAVAIGEMFWYIPSSVQLVLAPHIASSTSANISEITVRYARNLSLLLLIAIIIFLQFDKLLISTAFGQPFLPAYLPLRFLLPGIFALTLSKILSADFFGKGKPTVTSFASFAALIVNVSCNLLLIPLYGISGAAIASSISYSVQTAILIFIFIKTTDYNLKDLLIISKKDIEYYKDIFLKKRLP